MSQAELLTAVLRALDAAGVAHMVTGSLASSLHGEPRSTHGIDLVIDLDADRLDALLASFPAPRYYLSPEAAREAVRSDGMFNLIDAEEGDKVDFWLLTEDPFDRSRFARRYEEQVLGIRMHVSTPEDTILQKLKWSRLGGGSARAYTDALRVFEVQQGRLDIEYLERWVESLGIGDLWTRLRSEAEPI
ncbi:MAG: hypothetical protein RRA92_09820 [Gemmatimonadota bacterium]|nr:hypothetical protein [Gemmatimonadota bacterium]